MLIYSWLRNGPIVIVLVVDSNDSTSLNVETCVNVGLVTLAFCLINTGLFALLSNLLVIYTFPILRLLTFPVG